jgi:hypothetical protein
LKLWPKTHFPRQFRRQPNAAAADLSLCAISSIIVREGGGRDGAEVPELLGLGERDDAERVVDIG